MILPVPTNQECPTQIDAVSREWVWLAGGDWLAVSPITPPSSLPPGDSVGTDHGFVTFPLGESRNHIFGSLFLSRSRSGPGRVLGAGSIGSEPGMVSLG